MVHSNMRTCSTHKRVFITHDQAVEALLDARVRYNYPKGGGPVSVYECSECGYFHLTSQGTIDQTLHQQLKDGKIDLQKEANRWLDKLNKR